MKRTLAFILCAIFLCAPVFALGNIEVSAKAAAVFDTLTGEFLFEKNADDILPMASTTKIMTALIALETLDMSTQYTVLPEWTGVEGSSMYLKAGEKLTALDLLHGLLLQSGNDAAKAIACIVSGSEQAFVQLMNDRAVQLGLQNTSFESASGLDGESHHTTAHELAIIASKAMENSDFKQIVAAKSYGGANRTMMNHNKLLFSLEGACGVKTGFTKKSGRCLVSAIERGGRTVIAVTLNAPNDWDDHTRMAEKAFENASVREILPPAQELTCDVTGGTLSQAAIYINESCSLNLTDAEFEQICVLYDAPRFAYAPISAGEPYGKAKVMIGDKTIFETEMYFADAIEIKAAKQSYFTRLINKIKALF